MSSAISEIGAMRVNNSTGAILSESVRASSIHPTATDQSSLDVVNGQIIARDDGITSAKMATSHGKWSTGSLTASDSGGAVFNIENTAGDGRFVTRVLINVTTAATGACTIDVGIAAAASTSNDKLFDGLDVGTATGLFDNSDATDQGTNGKASALWASGDFITASMASGATAGLVGTYRIYYTSDG